MTNKIYLNTNEIIFLNADHQLVDGSAVHPLMCEQTMEHMREVHGVTDGYTEGAILDLSWWLQQHLKLHPPITRKWPDLNEPGYGRPIKMKPVKR
jgi:hypothetical protein